MDQCFPAKKYPKIFLISSKLITTKPPLFSSDMLNHPRLQFLELHKSQKWEERSVKGVTACSPGNKLQLPLLWAARPGRTSHPHSLPSLPPRPAPSLQPHCLCPPLLFSHTYSPLFPLSWFDLLWAWILQQHKVARAFLQKLFSLPIKWGTSCSQWNKDIASCTQVGVLARGKEETEHLVHNIWKLFWVGCLGFFLKIDRCSQRSKQTKINWFSFHFQTPRCFKTSSLNPILISTTCKRESGVMKKTGN